MSMKLLQKKEIISTNNEKIKKYKKLLLKKYRDQTNMFIVEGDHLVAEAQKAQLIHEILTTDLQKNGTKVNPQILKSLSTTQTIPTIIAVCFKPPIKKIGQKVVVLSDVQDPGNVGTLIRTSVAFNYDDIIISGVDVFNPKVIRSSQGAIFKINIIQTDDVSKFFENFQVIGAVLDKNAKKYDKIHIKTPFMIVLGNEGNGLGQSIIEKLNQKIYIPIHFESLNVASAGAILLNAYQHIKDGD